MYSLTRSAGEKFYSNVSNIDLAKDRFHLIIRSRALIGWNCESKFTWFEKLWKVAFWYSNKIFCFSLSVKGLHGLRPSTWWVGRPRYLSRPCKLQWIDCRGSWRLKYTQRGACLQLQPQAVYNDDKEAKVWSRQHWQDDPRTVFISWCRRPGP